MSRSICVIKLCCKGYQLYEPPYLTVFCSKSGKYCGFTWNVFVVHREENCSNTGLQRRDGKMMNKRNSKMISAIYSLQKQ